MLRDILTRDEMEELLSDIPDEDSGGSGDGKRMDHVGHHTEITIRYLQQTVQELQREMAELRERVQFLENPHTGPKPAGNPLIKKTPAAEQQGSEPKLEAVLSRTEKYKSTRGKWF